jgi:hypothetical protein
LEREGERETDKCNFKVRSIWFMEQTVVETEDERGKASVQEALVNIGRGEMCFEYDSKSLWEKKTW